MAQSVLLNYTNLPPQAYEVMYGVMDDVLPNWRSYVRSYGRSYGRSLPNIKNYHPNGNLSFSEIWAICLRVIGVGSQHTADIMFSQYISQSSQNKREIKKNKRKGTFPVSRKTAIILLWIIEELLSQLKIIRWKIDFSSSL